MTTDANGSGRARRRTATSNFGVSRRESHDATAFYERFGKPELSDDDQLGEPAEVDRIWCADARDMTGRVAEASVALVVTSPPYFAGKAYEEALGKGHIPASYREYLSMLEDVFAECRRVLEPGGRIAVNVANLGRKPYRSLSADVILILQRLGLLLRGEVIWLKQRAAGGSCAWGTFQKPGNPVMRDLTERIIVAGKGRFDRAVAAPGREAAGLPHEGSMFKDDFIDATTDLWEIAPESATRIGHPAPFPVELPRRLIELYTYRGDLVLDPFIGSGSTAVAAMRSDRHFVGFDTDPTYVALAEARVEQERAEGTEPGNHQGMVPLRATVAASAVRRSGTGAPEDLAGETPDDVLARSIEQGQKAADVARLALEWAGFSPLKEKVAFARYGLDVTYGAETAGARWLFDVVGGFSSTRPGLRRSDTLWRVLGKASVLHEAGAGRLVVLTTDLPAPGSPGERALASLVGDGRPVHQVVHLRDPVSVGRLRELAGSRGAR